MMKFDGPKLTVNLKCLKPMIDFQHYKQGAMLRASEVKTKLDEYLIEHESWDKLKEFQKSSEDQALDYEMQMVAKNSANLDSDIKDIPDDFIYSGVLKDYKCIIFCSYEKLKKLLVKYLKMFLMDQN